MHVHVFRELVRRGFGYSTAFQLVAAHMAHTIGYSLQTARNLLSAALTQDDKA